MNDVAVGLGQRRRRRSGVEAERLVREFEASGLTRQAFCAGRGLSVAALDRYRRRHGRLESGEGRLVPVEVLAGKSAAASSGSSALWLELPNGWRVGVGNGFDAAALRRLLQVLEPA